MPAVLGADSETLVLPWLPPGSPSTADAERLGRELAALHGFGAGGFGASWPGWIGAAALDNRPANASARDRPAANQPAGSWPAFYGQRRLAPYVRTLAERGALGATELHTLERLIDRLPALTGPPEPPARIHGDLWRGNVLWSGSTPSAAGRVWPVDPAAHGGHREADLAMLALFGLPGLDRLVAAYQEAAPLADGWRDRQDLHQLHPLLVHAVLFGAGYLSQALAVARRYAG